MNYAVLARRYARALYMIAKERNLVAECRQGLEAFGTAMTQCADLRAVLTRDRLPGASRRTIIEQVAKTVGCNELTMQFVQVVSRKGRSLALPQIAECFAALANMANGVVVAEVITAEPLVDTALLQSIRDKMASVYGKNIELQNRTDASVIGGVVIRVGDEIFDGSVVAYLRRMRQQLLRATV